MDTGEALGFTLNAALIRINALDLQLQPPILVHLAPYQDLIARKQQQERHHPLISLIAALPMSR